MCRLSSSVCGAASIAARRRRRRSCTMWAATLSGTSACTACAAANAARSPTTAGSDLPLDPDPVDGVLGDVAVGGDHHDDRLADVVDHAVGERVRRLRRVQRRVRDQQRQRLGDPAVEVLVGVDRDQAVDVERVGDVDVDDAGVRVRAAQERGGQRLVAEVVEVAAVAGGQAQVLPALRSAAPNGPGVRSRAAHGRCVGGAEPGVPERSAWRRRSLMPASPQELGGAQHGLHDVLVARCTGTGCRRSPRGPPPRSGRGCARRKAVTVVTKPGVQKPHCRPWHSMKACCTGPSPPSADRQPSIVVTR